MASPFILGTDDSADISIRLFASANPCVAGNPVVKKASELELLDSKGEEQDDNKDEEEEEAAADKSATAKQSKDASNGRTTRQSDTKAAS
ncbi:TPA: hypothetical protein ACH3X1_010809 [Trebouxia sp. C0004]